MGLNKRTLKRYVGLAMFVMGWTISMVLMYPMWFGGVLVEKGDQMWLANGGKSL